jgi:hypothetical protein
MVMWLFNPDLIKDSSTPKLILLALAFMLPIIGFNSGLISYIVCYKQDTDGTRWRTQSLPLGFAASLLIVGVPLLISYLAGLRFKTFLIVALVLQGVYTCICIPIIIKNRRRAK